METLKLDIEYSRSNMAEAPCGAKATVEGQTYFGCGATWTAAKERLLSNIRSIMEHREIPPPETVEVQL